MITCNTLLDNSNEALQVASAIKDLIECQECHTIKIATGYWDIPGTALVWQQLKALYILCIHIVGNRTINICDTYE